MHIHQGYKVLKDEAQVGGDELVDDWLCSEAGCPEAVDCSVCR